ncbi:MAG TPA: DUF4249 domain-containing protein [Chryseosolibacter sp.]
MAVKGFMRVSLIASILLGSCVEPFEIPVRNDEVSFLVVDGYINTQTHTATVTLSRAIPLSEETAFPRESGALVSIEGEDGKVYNLMTQGDGMYELANTAFENNKRFRLQVKTSNGKEYLSDVITTRAAPPIGSIGWTAESDGLSIKISSEDLSNSTRYYRWEYSETWRYESHFGSEFKFENGKPVTRTASEQLKTCYRTENSEQILIGTTMGLANDKFVDQPVVFVPAASPKTKFEYSALVKQFALSKEAYEYWEQLRTNTESLGGLFDPQPGELRGNIKNTDDPTEPVIGFFDGGAVSEKRVFIKFEELPPHLRVYGPPQACIENFVEVDKVSEVTGSNMLTYGVYQGPTLIGYMYTSNECADCTLFGGTTIKPDFWLF